MSPKYSSPYGPVTRYTVRVELLDGAVHTVRYCTSQGSLNASAVAMAGVLKRVPNAEPGTISVTDAEAEFVPSKDDIVDYWDVA